MTRLEHPPEIEKLSDLSWRRIENGVFQSLELERSLSLPPARETRSRRVWLAGLAGAACAAAALLLALSILDQEKSSSTGHRSRVVTAESVSSVVVGDADLAVAPDSAIWVDHHGDEVDITLDRGSVECKVAPREGRPPFTVHAGNVRVEVVGTRFAVHREGDSARVEVYKGVVKVISNGSIDLVRAGQHWPADEVAAVEEIGDERTVDRRRPARTPKASRARADERSDSRDARTQRASDDKGDEAKESTVSASDLYERAARLESSDPAAAIALYRKIAAGSDGWAANALYAQARLELERGNAGQARGLLERYLERFPSGANAADARHLLRSL